MRRARTSICKIKLPKRQKLRGYCGVLLVHCSAALCASADCLCCTLMRGNQRKCRHRKSICKIKLPKRQMLRGYCGVLLVHCSAALCASADCPCCTLMRGNQRMCRNRESICEKKLPKRQKLRGYCRVLLVHCSVASCASSDCLCGTGMSPCSLHCCHCVLTRLYVLHRSQRAEKKAEQKAEKAERKEKKAAAKMTLCR